VGSIPISPAYNQSGGGRRKPVFVFVLCFIRVMFHSCYAFMFPVSDSVEE